MRTRVTHITATLSGLTDKLSECASNMLKNTTMSSKPDNTWITKVSGLNSEKKEAQQQLDAITIDMRILKNLTNTHVTCLMLQAVRITYSGLTKLLGPNVSLTSEAEFSIWVVDQVKHLNAYVFF